MARVFRGIILLASAAAVFGTTPGAFAETNPPGPGAPPSADKQEEIRKKIEAVKIWRLTEALKLDAATSAKLSSLVSALDQQRKDTLRDQAQTMKALRQALKTPKPDEQKLKIALDKLQQDRHILDELRDKELNGIKEILTIEQQARFVIFQQEFRHEMLGMIEGARRSGRLQDKPQSK